MKLLLAAVLATAFAAPVMSMEMPGEGASFELLMPYDGLFDRRSGQCPKSNDSAREGSTCGGV